jgi:hypothetical protein
LVFIFLNNLGNPEKQKPRPHLRGLGCSRSWFEARVLKKEAMKKANGLGQTP